MPRRRVSRHIHARIPSLNIYHVKTNMFFNTEEAGPLTNARKGAVYADRGLDARGN